MNDIVTFGEAMIRLSPPYFRRLEQTNLLEVNVGGSELNVAIGASRLGLKSAWISRLPLNPLGLLIRNKAREQGVDTSHIIWNKNDRAGLYFVEFGASPRASKVLYDRKNSAISRIKIGEVDWENILKEAKLFMVSGITPALSESAKEVTEEAVKEAKKAGCKVAIDLNYRAKLWSEKEANKCMSALMENTDLLFTTEEDTFRVFGIKGKDYEEVAKKLNDKFGFEVIAITLRENISVWKNKWTAIAYSKGKIYKTKTYELEIVDRLGGGDSFTAGCIWGYLQGDLQKGVDYGVAFSALKHSIPGDINWVNREEVESQVKGAGLRISR